MRWPLGWPLRSLEYAAKARGFKLQVRLVRGSDRSLKIELKKYLDYYQLGSRQGRIELHSRLSAIAYRYIAPAKTQLGFQGRCTLLEDFFAELLH